ncbi:hypothetical protein QL285_015587 [Trifolium repens]|nr:hypothetical protein QL285_015587 [Trifolium repens]
MEIVGFRFHEISYRWKRRKVERWGLGCFREKKKKKGGSMGCGCVGCFKKKKKKGGAMNERRTLPSFFCFCAAGCLCFSVFVVFCLFDAGCCWPVLFVLFWSLH